ncbi:MAG TPA: Ig-like domain-containing protein [Gemmatimonadaceae bacterium]|nr:Ig-like domain-containing protein [Gemmatimonadaceae bacterium]
MRRLLTFLAAGTLALSACSDDSVGPPANYVFVVIPNETDISLTQDDSAEVSAIVQDTISGGQMYYPDIDWSSDDPDVAVVEPNGDGWQVRAVGDGSTTIHAVFNAYHGPVEGTIAVSVTGVPATGFTVGPDGNDDNVALYPGDADTLRVLVQDADGNELSARRVSWDNDADSVASVELLTKVWTDTIDVDGEDSVVVDSVTYHAVVSGESVGNATLVAEVEGMQQTINVTVSPRPVDKIVMNPDAAALHVGDKLTITATPKAANGESLDRDVTWGSSNPLVATVDSTGVVTAVGAGNASILATSEGKIGITSLLVVANE